MACLRHQRASAVLGLLAEGPELTLRIVVPIRLGAAFPRGRLLLYPVREHCGALMGCGGRGCGWPQCAAHAAREGAESARTLPQTRRRHASGATGPLWAPSTARREPCAAPHPVVRPAPYPGGPRCVRRPFPPLEAPCGEDGVDRQGWEARHVGQRHTGAPVQRSAESTRGLGALRWSMGCRWGRAGGGITSNQGRNGAEDPCAFLSAGRHGRRGNSREGQGLGERAAMRRALIPRERLAHDVRTGGAALGSIRCAGPRVARSRPARAEQAEACHAWHIPQHMVQGPLHVVPRLVPGLQMFDRHLAQMVAMAAATAELADGLRRTQRRCQHSIQEATFGARDTHREPCADAPGHC
jgi:hypothetical protein